MRAYKCVKRFFCTVLRRYIPIGAYVCRWENITKIIIKDAPQSDQDIFNILVDGLEYDAPSDVTWLYAVEPPPLGTRTDYFTLQGNYPEDAAGNIITGGSGATGATGPTGPAGFQGPIGFQGHDGAQGPQGLAGIQGVPGGAQGYQGPIGIQGNQGFAGVGVQGPAGLQGNQGLAGNQGAVGSQGAAGAQGNQGVAGPQGIAGVQGAAGAAGFQGNQGLAGAQGNQGRPGIDGPQGVVGFQGVAGSQGRVGSQGNVGSTGVQGNQGSQGIAGTGNQGPDGVQGGVGSQGAAGFQGATGSGVQGPLGFQGFQGLQGSGSGSAVSRYQISNVAGEEVEVLASAAGVTYSRTGNIGTFSIPAGVHVFSVLMRIPTTIHISGQFLVDMGTNDMGNSSFANQWQPIVQGFREDSGGAQALTVTWNSSNPRSQFTINNLNTLATTHLRLSF